MPRRNKNCGDPQRVERTDFSYLLTKPNTVSKAEKPMSKQNKNNMKGRVFVNESKEGR